TFRVDEWCRDLQLRNQEDPSDDSGNARGRWSDARIDRLFHPPSVEPFYHAASRAEDGDSRGEDPAVNRKVWKCWRTVSTTDPDSGRDSAPCGSRAPSASRRLRSGAGLGECGAL